MNGLQPAPLYLRGLAALVDFAIVSVMVLAIIIGALIMGMMFGGEIASNMIAEIQQGADPAKMAVFGGFVLIVTLLALMAMHAYYIQYEYRQGATPGKKLFGLKVISTTGEPLTKGQATYRDLIRWYVDFTLIFPAIISIAVTKKRQRIGDILAKTMVVPSHFKAGNGAVTGGRSLYMPPEQFQLLKAQLTPKAVDAKIAQDYLRFANQAYIMGRKDLMATERLKWLPQVRAHLRNAESLPDDQVMRFFAELCFQMANGASRGK